MNGLAEKKAILEQAGFTYLFDRQVFYNPESRMVFSIEYVEDHSPQSITDQIGTRRTDDNWQFYFNQPPSDAVRHELLSALL